MFSERPRETHLPRAPYQMLSPNQQKPSTGRSSLQDICLATDEHAPTCHESKLQVVNFYNLSHSSFNYSFQNLK